MLIKSGILRNIVGIAISTMATLDVDSGTLTIAPGVK